MTHKFVKVGDVVKIKQADAEKFWSKLDPRKKYIVKKTSPHTGYEDNTQFITQLEDNRSNIINLKINERYFDVVWEEKSEVMKNKFAVGDKVISVKDTSTTPEGFVGYVVNDDLNVVFKYSVRKEFTHDVVKSFKEDELELLAFGRNNPQFAASVTPQDIQGIVKPDVINSPKHYAVFESVEAIQVIASSMTQDQFYGYCLGNILKYRLRAGGKDDVMQELGKADKYQELYTEHKYLCKGEK